MNFRKELPVSKKRQEVPALGLPAKYDLKQGTLPHKGFSFSFC